MRTVGIVTARGGSKGIPRKNLAELGGRPLLAWTAEAALASRQLSRVILSTDDPEIADVGRCLGLGVPGLRPADLARDDTPTLVVLRDVMSSLEQQGDRYDAMCLLQPTSPFRSPGEIDGCIELLESSGADAVITIQAVPSEYNPHWTYFMNEEHELRLSTGEAAPIPRRQLLPPAYHRDGSVYVTRREVLMVQNSLYGKRTLGYCVEGEGRVNIDRPVDLERAREIVSQGFNAIAARRP